MRDRVNLVAIWLLAIGLCLASVVLSVAHAQTAGTITFSVEATAGQASITPVVKWSTSPVATSCTASGGWAGTKAASGTESLAAITKGATYKIDCSWADSKATLSWTPPSQNVDGSALTDLAGTKIYYGTSATVLSSAQTVSGAGITTAVLSPLTPGTWYFALRSYTVSGVESDLSVPVSKVVGSASGTKSVALSVNIPNSPSNVTVQ